jgi:hypothetical protein
MRSHPTRRLLGIPLRLAAVAAALACGLALAPTRAPVRSVAGRVARRVEEAPVAPPLSSLAGVVVPAALEQRPAGFLDRDGDGLDDRLEDALLQRYAPVVLLHPDEPALPASAGWILARAQLQEAPGSSPRVMTASALGALAVLFRPGSTGADTRRARLRMPAEMRGGSADPSDWTVYGHAYRARDGGILLQYWFLYAFNDAFWAFDHDGDWEHVTVKLDGAGRPEGAFYSRHEDSAPGPWFGWAELSREGDHPVVLSGRGTHASYPSPDEAPFWERTCNTADPRDAAARGCTVWRTWTSGERGVENVGERGAPRSPFLAWPGRWGTTGAFGLDTRHAAPPGPAFQHGWCSEGADDACP